MEKQSEATETKELEICLLHGEGKIIELDSVKAETHREAFEEVRNRRTFDEWVQLDNESGDAKTGNTIVPFAAIGESDAKVFCITKNDETDQEVESFEAQPRDLPGIRKFDW